MMTFDFESLLKHWAIRNADHPVFLAPGREPLLWRDLQAAIDVIASYLHQICPRPDARFAIFLPASPEAALIALAAMQSGIAVPLDPAANAAQLRRTIARLHIDAIVFDGDQSTVEIAQNCGVSAICAAAADGAIGNINLSTCHLPLARPTSESFMVPAQTRLLLQTSGTTAVPKLVPLTATNLVAASRALVATLGLGPDDRALSLLAQFHIGGVWDLLGAPLFSGGSVIFGGSYSHAAYAAGTALLPTWVQLAPAMITNLLDDPAREHAASLRVIRSVSAALPAPLKARAQALLGAPVIEIYGMSETAGVITSQSVATPAGSVGASAGLEVTICDADGKKLPTGATGEVVVSGAQVSPGYIGATASEAMAFTPNGFRTGDLGHLDEAGQLWLTGRIKDLINRGGEMISPAEIEAVLMALPWVRETAVFGLPHPTLGESINAAIVVSETAPVDAAHEARQAVRHELGEAKWPALVRVVADLPRSAGGKLLRNALAAELGSAAAVQVTPNDDAKVAATSRIAQWVAAILAEALGVDTLGGQDDFFGLGGNSLQAAHAVALMQAQFPEAILYVSSLYDAPTPERFEQVLRQHYPEVATRILGQQIQRAARATGPITEQMTATFNRATVCPMPEGARDGQAKNGRAVFILSAPRSGSTLLRAMLGGHPALFAPPELYLLSHQDMASRQDWFAGSHASQLEGLTRAWMAARGLGAADAAADVAKWLRENLSTGNVFQKLQQEVAPRLLVDKTPFYAAHRDVLDAAEAGFDRPLYIHLSRHPYGMIRSFEEARLDQLWWPRLASQGASGQSPFLTRHFAEMLWVRIETNIAGFLTTIDTERHIHLRFEDLVTRPAEAMGRVCAWLGLPFEPDMLDPQAQTKERMTDGLHMQSRMIGDPKFHRHVGVEASAADQWKQMHGTDFLSESTLQLVRHLGYEADATFRPARPPSHMTIEI